MWSVFKAQPSGFINSTFSDHVCCPKESTSWSLSGTTCLVSTFQYLPFGLGFQTNRFDSSFFYFHRGTIVINILLYLDDIIVTGNDLGALFKFIYRSHQEFIIKNLGRLNYFLGLEISYTPTGLFVGQAKYDYS